MRFVGGLISAILTLFSFIYLMVTASEKSLSCNSPDSYSGAFVPFIFILSLTSLFYFFGSESENRKLRKEKSEIQTQLNQLVEYIDKLQTQINESCENIDLLKTEINQLKGKKIDKNRFSMFFDFYKKRLV